jgi:hypothetical protein
MASVDTGTLRHCVSLLGSDMSVEFSSRLHAVTGYSKNDMTGYSKADGPVTARTHIPSPDPAADTVLLERLRSRTVR